MVANLAAGYNAQPRDVNGIVRDGRRRRSDKSGVAAEAAAADFPHLAPEARPTVWLPDAYTWLVAGPRERRRRRSSRAERTSVGSSDIVLAMPEPLAEAIGWDEEPPAWDDVFEAADDDDLWSRPRPPRVGRLQARQDEPARRDLRRGGDVRLVRHRRGLARRASPPAVGAPTGRARDGAPARARDEPLHGDARALPLARAPGRARPARPPTSSRP